ncbi:hypothetical protein HMPREF2534_04716 [Bacteroides thetaiotaomicron]|nr:hypothetical protein HMPREF2534_04716 [Bacteroides thetaiotaomicron]
MVGEKSIHSYSIIGIFMFHLPPPPTGTPPSRRRRMEIESTF